MIIQNAVCIKTPRRKPIFLKSIHRHDFREYKFTNGSTIAVDGGKEYIRRVGWPPKSLPKGVSVQDFSLEEGDHPLRIRNRLLWGTYGKKGGGSLRFVRLVDCSTPHLRAILKNCQPLSPIWTGVITSILSSRSKKKASQ